MWIGIAYNVLWPGVTDRCLKCIKLFILWISVQFTSAGCSFLHASKVKFVLLLKLFPNIQAAFEQIFSFQNKHYSRAEWSILITSTSLNIIVLYVSTVTAHTCCFLSLKYLSFIYFLSFEAWLGWRNFLKVFSELDCLNIFNIDVYFYIICPFPKSICFRWHKTQACSKEKTTNPNGWVAFSRGKHIHLLGRLKLFLAVMRFCMRNIVWMVLHNNIKMILWVRPMSRPLILDYISANGIL